MNFNPIFNPNVVVNPPIIVRRVNDIHRVFITEQPHILENQTRIFNHHILRHTCCERPLCCDSMILANKTAAIFRLSWFGMSGSRPWKLPRTNTIRSYATIKQ